MERWIIYKDNKAEPIMRDIMNRMMDFREFRTNIIEKDIRYFESQKELEDFNNDVLERAMDIVKRIKFRTSLGLNSNMLLEEIEGMDRI